VFARPSRSRSWPVVEVNLADLKALYVSKTIALEVIVFRHGNGVFPGSSRLSARAPRFCPIKEHQADCQQVRQCKSGLNSALSFSHLRFDPSVAHSLQGLGTLLRIRPHGHDPWQCRLTRLLSSSSMARFSTFQHPFRYISKPLTAVALANGHTRGPQRCGCA